jgi:hypothetical protein
MVMAKPWQPLAGSYCYSRYVTPRAHIAFTTLIATLVVALPTNVFASLGASVTTVDADRQKMQGALLRIVAGQSYTMHEVRSATGTNVREYADSGGTVFAVAWDGPWMPDMSTVLGDRFTRYQQLLRQHQLSKKKARGNVLIDEPDLFVQMSGRMRAFTGRAMVPALMPAGVQREAIR